MKLEYLVDVTNEIVEILSGGPPPSCEQLASIFYRAADALQSMLEDNELTQELLNLGLDEQSTKARAELKDDLRRFVTVFLALEKKALIQAGLSDRASEHILWTAACFRSFLDQDTQPKRILEAIQELKHEMIEEADHLRKAGYEHRENFLRKAEGWAIPFFGAVLIGVDYCLVRDQAMQTISFNIGSNMATRGRPKAGK